MAHSSVRVFLSIVVALCAALSALEARAAPPPPKHPAVVRVVVPEGSSTSLGSGALVAANEDHGLVVTNWHVVRDGNGTATVVFPDGFRSTATVVRVDRDWDLAALLIWRPRVQPIPLASNRPAIGEPLWIAGYGRGSYRMAGGQCTHYLSPGGRLPFDMIELSTGARQGDSGGPILNQRGELAGVLFGAAWGKTSGSHCLRVKQFLDPVLYQLDGPSRGDGAMLAKNNQPPARQPDRTIAARETPVAMIAAAPSPSLRSNGTRIQPNAAGDDSRRLSDEQPPWSSATPTGSAFAAPPEPAVVEAAPSEQLIPTDVWRQAKNVLAMIGLVAVCFHVLRWIGK